MKEDTKTCIIFYTIIWSSYHSFVVFFFSDSQLTCFLGLMEDDLSPLSPFPLFV
ncbi:hypothetical protein YC2023_023394 [Brassica napus]